MVRSSSSQAARDWSQPTRIAVLGSSISIQRKGYLPRLKQLLKSSTGIEHLLLNASLGGTTSKATLCYVAGNLFYDIKGFRPDIVLIEKAPNDRIYNYQQLDLSARQDKEEAIYAHMSTLVYLVRQHGAEPVVLFSYFEETGDYGLDVALPNGYLARVYKRIAEDLGVPILDVASHLKRVISQCSDKEEIMIDDVHLTEAGSEQMAAYIADRLLALPGPGLPRADLKFTAEASSDAEKLAVLKPVWNDKFETSLLTTGFYRLAGNEVLKLEIPPDNSYRLMGMFLVSDQQSGWLEIRDAQPRVEGDQGLLLCAFDRMSYLPRVHFIDLQGEQLLRGSMQFRLASKAIDLDKTVQSYYDSKMFDTAAEWALNMYLRPLLDRKAGNSEANLKLIAVCVQKSSTTAWMPVADTGGQSDCDSRSTDVLPAIPTAAPVLAPIMNYPIAHSKKVHETGMNRRYWPGAFDPEVADTKRHYVMLSHGLSLIQHLAPESLLTIGDNLGRDAGFFKRAFPHCHCIASDLKTDGILQAVADGYLDEVMDVDVEAIPFPDKSVDIVVAKEAFHHWPRPMYGYYEMLRVARKAVLLIEPNDYIYSDPSKPHLDQESYGDQYEEVGNFVYQISIRELLKASWALYLPECATLGFNDPYKTPFVFDEWQKEKAYLDRLGAEGARQFNLFAFVAYLDHFGDAALQANERVRIYKRKPNPFTETVIA